MEYEAAQGLQGGNGKQANTEGGASGHAGAIVSVPLRERFRQFWNDPETSARQRKRAVRLVIEDVTVHKTDVYCGSYSLQRGSRKERSLSRSLCR